jgi:hypothetical protein
MNHLEGDAYANFHYSFEYTGPSFYLCKCGVWSTEEYNIKHGDRCEDCGYFFELDDSGKFEEAWEHNEANRNNWEK